MSNPVRTYIDNFTRLLVMAGKMLPDNQYISEVRNKFNIAKNDENSFVELTGPVIWEYREQIKRNNRAEIMSYNYKSRIESACTDEDDKQLAVNFIATILDRCKTVTEAEWTAVHSVVSSILQAYSNYLLKCKAEMNK